MRARLLFTNLLAVLTHITLLCIHAHYTALHCTDYAATARWAWYPNGWATALNSDSSNLLFGCGTIDFAGSGVVHVCGGFAALVFCIFIGPRAGRYVNGRVSVIICYHNSHFWS
jgi:ammonia channel protein AmtB